MINLSINRRIIEVWNDYCSKNNNGGKIYPPIFYPEIIKSRVVFVGMNPSSSGFDKIRDKENGNGLEYWCDISNKLEEYVKKILENENINQCGTENKKLYPYFRPLDNMTMKCMSQIDKDIEWNHIDLFQMYNKNQGESLRVLDDGKSLTDFGKQQFEIFKSILESSDPKCVIVINAAASRIIRREYKENIDVTNFNELGYDYIELNNKKIPILFSSMLSGQRALDNESRRRLCHSACKSLADNSVEKFPNDYKCTCSNII